MGGFSRVDAALPGPSIFQKAGQNGAGAAPGKSVAPHAGRFALAELFKPDRAATPTAANDLPLFEQKAMHAPVARLAPAQRLTQKPIADTVAQLTQRRDKQFCVIIDRRFSQDISLF